MASIRLPEQRIQRSVNDGAILLAGGEEVKGIPRHGAAGSRCYDKEVLHADLDDPYLGLGKLLFDNYVFSAEEKK